jgi:hypothetical protein
VFFQKEGLNSYNTVNACLRAHLRACLVKHVASSIFYLNPGKNDEERIRKEVSDVLKEKHSKREINDELLRSSTLPAASEEID